MGRGSASGIRCVRRAFALATCSLLTACTVLPSDGSSREPRILDARNGRFVSERELVDALATARYRLLGEVHDNPAHHEIRARLIRRMAAHGARPAVVFEQFDIEHDAALRAAQADGADADRLAEAGQLDRKSWRWPLHEPVVSAALSSRLPIRAGNLSRAQLRGDVQALSADTAGIWHARLHGARWSAAQAATLDADIVESHCGMLPRTIVPRLALAQRMRDAAMAQALVDAASADGAILIAGNGHVRADVGVPVYLHAPALRDAAARSISIGFVEVRPDERHADSVRELVADHPGLDYLWLTDAVAREDPCAGIVAPASTPAPK
jgi:uncharacterized iron-regulated protein